MLTLFAGTIVGCITVGLVVLVPAVRQLFVAWLDVRRASGVVSILVNLKTGEPAPKLPDTSANTYRHFTDAFLRAYRSFDTAVRHNCLTEFNLDHQFERIRAALGGMLNPIRGRAGVLILSGLIITLINLQSSVQSLQTAFTTLAEHPPTDGSTSVDVTSTVTHVMATVAGAAHRAFLFSVVFILIAALLLIGVLYVQAKATRIYQEFVEWAHDKYDDSLPFQTPLGEVAAKFDQTTKSLTSLAAAFNAMILEFGSLRDFAGSIENARVAIEDAMAKLPGHIQVSMGSLSERFVAGVSEGLRESNENSKHVLAIYGHQQHRIDQIQAEAAAIGEYSKQVAEVSDKLKGLPELVVAASKATTDLADSANRLDSTVAELAVRVEDLPVKELRADVQSLITSTEAVKSHATNVEKFVGVVSANLELLLGLPGQITEIGTGVALQKAAVDVLIAAVGTMQGAVKDLPVAQMGEATRSLSKALERVGTLQGETERLLAEISARMVSMDAVGTEVRTRLEQVGSLSLQLISEYQNAEANSRASAEEIKQALARQGNALVKEILDLKSRPEMEQISQQLGRLEGAIISLRTQPDLKERSASIG